MQTWAVALAHPLCERRALLNLQRQNFTCYAPLIKQTRIVKGRRTYRDEFLFGRYLFVAIADQWRSILSTFGVAQLIMNRDLPASLPEQEIENFRAREVNGYVVLTKPERFKRGETVHVHRGQFSGADAVYQGMSQRDREIVLLNILGRQTRVELAVGDLELV